MPSFTEMLSAKESLADPRGGPCSLLPLRTLHSSLWPTGVFTEAPQKPSVLPSPTYPEGTKLGLSLYQEALRWPKLRYCRPPQGQPRPPPGLATPGLAT